MMSLHDQSIHASIGFLKSRLEILDFNLRKLYSTTPSEVEQVLLIPRRHESSSTGTPA